jgi:hypothetical protein
MVFFERKNQNRLKNLGSLYPERPQPKQSKVFLLPFSQKKKSFLAFLKPPARSTWAAPRPQT